MLDAVDYKKMSQNCPLPSEILYTNREEKKNV